MEEPSIPVARQGSALAEELAQEGYQPGTPASQLVLGAVGCSVDEDLCTVYLCTCGHQGLQFKPFTRGESYRAFAVCPTCDAAYEF